MKTILININGDLYSKSSITNVEIKYFDMYHNLSLLYFIKQN